MMSETMNNIVNATSLNVESDDVNITLTGCGKITEWKFPKDLLRCPILNCQELFESRSETIHHFKIFHANRSLLCHLCEFPVYANSPTDFEHHFKIMHPNETIPFQFDQKMLSSAASDKENSTDQCNGGNEKTDDLITLSGCKEITYWNFPENLWACCPVINCSEFFVNRTAAKNHFILTHAMNAILCAECEIPIIAHSYDDYNEHYRRVHPNISSPFHSKGTNKELSCVTSDLSMKEVNSILDDVSNNQNADQEVDDLIILEACGFTSKWQFPLNQTKCPVQRCEKEFETRASAIVHYKQQHAKGSILCELCNKPLIINNSFGSYLLHHKRLHLYQPIPYKFNDDMESSVDKIPNSEKPEEDESKIEDEENEDVDDLITLEGCGQITKWRFPSNMNRCPVSNCFKSYRTRSEGITHYKETHAKKAILCSLCQKPFIVDLRGFITHYQNRHPYETIPYKFDTVPSQTKSIDSEMTIDDECSTGTTANDVDDLITLRGCGLVTKWKFPETTKCPIAGCQKENGIRTFAISHFKHAHAKHSVYCSECEAPTRAKSFSTFFEHFTKKHPNAELPTCLKNCEPKNYENETDSDTEVDDLITLSGCGQITKYRFPRTKRCPIATCRLIFDKRSKAISHYKKHHAKNYIFCSICESPLFVNHLGTFIRHYEEHHPHMDAPLNVNEADENEDEDLITLRGGGIITYWRFPKSNVCPIRVCDREFDNRSDAIMHYKIWHSINYLFCSICDKPIATKSLNNYKEHFEKMHPQLEIPDVKIIQPIDSDSDIDETDSEDEIVDDIITLKGLGIITSWKFPDVKNCPNKSCALSFSSRTKTLVHYKQMHADNMIMCSLCDKPISAHSKNVFIQHYHNMHPYKPVPYNLDDENQNEESQNKFETENDESNEDDLIMLKGCGQQMQWRFPKTNWTRCPVWICKKTFKIRSHAILHYKKIHARNYIFCTECQLPVYAPHISGIVKHYLQKHPGLELPKFIEPNEDDKLKQEINKGEDDLITLEGFGQNTQWRFPENITICPIRRCLKECGFRSQAIEHFKRKHAKIAVFCELCNHPICMKHRMSIVNHYDKVHHGSELPSFLNEQMSEPDIDDDEEVDDLITLGGGDKITHWRFPNTKICPIQNCRAQFTTRASAINHYKVLHAPKLVLCVECDKPFGAPIIYHYRKFHPDLEEPKNDDSENDLIILKGGGEINTWRFPDVKKCPIRNCVREFDDRSETIAHFKKQHTMNYQLCETCDGPVPTYKYTHFREHLEKHHNQDSKIESDDDDDDDDDEDDWITLSGGNNITLWQFPKNTKICPIKSCRKDFGVRSDAIDHYRKRHSTDYIYCVLCDKPVHTPYHSDFSAHYRKVHPNHQVPNDFRESVVVKMETNDCSVDDENSIDNLIELTGAGQLTYYRFPNISYCPVSMCGIKFQSYAHAICHFKQRHAPSHVFCDICQKPVSAKTLNKFKMHYSTIHKDEPFQRFDDDIDEIVKNEEKQEKPVLRSRIPKVKEIIETNDLICFESCGQITKWKFPEELTRCVINKCNVKFESRLDGILHYRKLHTKNAIYCSLCDMPIYATHLSEYMAHHRRQHADINVPLNVDGLVDSYPATANNINSDEDLAEDDDFTADGCSNEDESPTDEDVILLRGCDQITKWHFPNITVCPVHTCKMRFETRLGAITHYKEEHAKRSYYCSICKAPIVIWQRNHLEKHYRRKHPHFQVPSPLKQEKKMYLDDFTVKLEGCGKITFWQFPKTKRCPVFKCRQSFDSRATAMNHYKRKHARHYYCCSICRKPIYALNKKVLLLHYRIKHPKKHTPFSIRKSQTSVDNLQLKNATTSSYDDEASNQPNKKRTAAESNDTIILETCGIITEWKVPAHITECPVLNCKKSFKNHTLFMKHYRNEHRLGSFMCSVCDKPLRSTHVYDIKKHYDARHPNETNLPWMVSRRTQRKSIKTEPKIKVKQEQIDDIVLLEGLGKCVEWQFPQTTDCPFRSCKLSFKKRSAVIAHYRKEHAKKMTLCPICKKPISVSSAKNLHIHLSIQHRDHYLSTNSQHQHEFVKIKNEPGTVRKQTFCMFCGKIVENLKRHMDEMHTTEEICCPLKDCSIKSKDVDGLRQHWNKFHAHFKFPQIKEETHKINESNNDKCKHSKKRSASNAFNDERNKYQSTGKKRRIYSTERGNDNSTEHFTSSEQSSSEDETAVRTSKVPNKRKSVSESARIRESKVKIIGCSVVLEKLILDDRNSTQQNQVDQSAGQLNPVVLKVENINQDEQEDTKNFVHLWQPEIEMAITKFNPMEQPSTSNGTFHQQIHMNPIPITPTEMQQEINIKIEQPETCTEPSTIYLPDSDEENRESLSKHDQNTNQSDIQQTIKEEPK